ncbi:hypothetical protein BN903_15 [Halorubrum sp. AJ67]|nr:hypothetical protein BN903_15 [Halorubrum sp. AJ67]
MEQHGPRSCNERSRSGVPSRLLRGGGVRAQGVFLLWRALLDP